MGMQISSLMAGDPISYTRELPRENRPQLLGERRSSPEQQEASLAGRAVSRPPDLEQTTANLEQISLAFNRRLKFVIDENSNEVIVKVIDNETDKVIRELPPEELQRLHSRIQETIGFLFDRKV